MGSPFWRVFHLSIPEKVLQTLSNLAMQSFQDDNTHLQSMGSCQLEEVPSVHSIRVWEVHAGGCSISPFQRVGPKHTLCFFAWVYRIFRFLSHFFIAYLGSKTMSATKVSNKKMIPKPENLFKKCIVCNRP